MAKVNKAPLTPSPPSLSFHLATLLSIFLKPTLFISFLGCVFPPLPLFFLAPAFYPSNSPSQHLSLISPLQPFSGLYREGSNLRFILPPISNLRDPCCWRRIFRRPDLSHPVKLRSVKNGKIFQWLPVFLNRATRPEHHLCSVHGAVCITYHQGF